MKNSQDVADRGLNLVIYPSDLVGAARVNKIANSLQKSGLFPQTHAVGMRSSEELPEEETLYPDVKAVRIKTSFSKGRVARVLGQLLWPGRVERAYKNVQVSAVSAQRVRVLPLAYRLSKKTGAIFTYNAHELETEVLGFTGLKQKIAKLIERRYIMKTDLVSVVNDSIADWYEREYPGLPRPVVLTNTPIDSGGSVDLRSRLQIPDGELLYIHVGYISEGRNVPLILEEFSKVPHAHVVFLGDGSLRHLVEDAAATYSNIHWHPMVDPDEVVAHARGADVGLCLVEYASLSDELSTPNKLLESWVAGIPPLSSGLQEARRLLGEEASKTWVIDDPATELSSALARITVDDVEKFRVKWQQIPGWEAQASDLVKEYKRALEAKRST